MHADRWRAWVTGDMIHSTVLEGKAMKKFTKMELLFLGFSGGWVELFHFTKTDRIFFGCDTYVFQKFGFGFMTGEFHYGEYIHTIQIQKCGTCTASGVCGYEGVFGYDFCYSFCPFYGGMFYFLSDFCP